MAERGQAIGVGTAISGGERASDWWRDGAFGGKEGARGGEGRG